MLEIFGKQEGELKYSELVDCKTGEEFDKKCVSTKTQMGWTWRGFKRREAFVLWGVGELRWHILFIMYITEDVIGGRGKG